MKNVTKSLPLLALASLMLAGQASALSISDVDTNVVTDGVNLTIDDKGTVRLTGFIEDHLARRAIQRDVQKLDGVNCVVNQLTIISGGN